MIEDLDEGTSGPSRRGHVLVVSVLLAVGCVVAWSAATSTAFQGPFATPAPSAPVIRYTPGPTTRLDPAGGPFPFALSGPGCVIPGATTTQFIFLGGQVVTQTRPLSELLPTCPPGPRSRFER